MDQDLNPNLLENMIRQRGVLNSLGNGGLPTPMAQSPQNPDLTVHVNHFAGPSPITSQAQQAMAPEDNQTGVAPSYVPSDQNVPAPNKGPIDLSGLHPAESAFQQALKNEPMKADYHPSTARKIGGILAGIGAGFLGGGVKGAVEVGDQVRDAPYNSQHANWQQFAGNREKLATEEAAGTEAAGKSALQQSQIGEQNSLAGLHGAEKNKNVRELNLMRNTPEEVKQDKIDEAQGRLKVDTREAKLKDGSVTHLIQKNGLFYNPEKLMPDGSMMRVNRDAIEDISDEGKSLKETKDARLPANMISAIQTKKIIAAGVGGKTDSGITVDQSTFDAAKELDAKLARGDDPKGAFDSIVTKRNAERVAAGKPAMSSNELEALQTKLLSVEKPGGTIMVNPSDNSVFKAVPGSTLPKGSQTPTQLGTTEAKSAKELEDLKADQSFVNDYQNNQTHTGPGDEALLERFFNATKPSTGFRMNQAQIALLTKLRSFTEAVKAHIKGLTGGTLFSDQQRKEIVDQINAISKSKISAHGGSSTSQSDQLPGGISIQDIDAEIERRKGQK